MRVSISCRLTQEVLAWCAGIDPSHMSPVKAVPSLAPSLIALISKLGVFAQRSQQQSLT